MPNFSPLATKLLDEIFKTDAHMDITLSEAVPIIFSNLPFASLGRDNFFPHSAQKVKSKQIFSLRIQKMSTN